MIYGALTINSVNKTESKIIPRLDGTIEVREGMGVAIGGRRSGGIGWGALESVREVLQMLANFLVIVEIERDIFIAPKLQRLTHFIKVNEFGMLLGVVTEVPARMTTRLPRRDGCTVVVSGI